MLFDLTSENPLLSIQREWRNCPRQARLEDLPACQRHVNLAVPACQFVWHGGGFTRQLVRAGVLDLGLKSIIARVAELADLPAGRQARLELILY